MRRGGDSGMALMLALLFIVLLSVLVVDFCYTAHLESSRIARRSSQFQAHTASKSAVSMGLSLLKADLEAQSRGDVPAYDSLEDAWALGVPYQVMNEAVMQCVIEDERGKVALNALIRDGEEEPDEYLVEALRILFEERGADPGLADVILDWLDEDDDPRSPGAETDDYASLDVPYRAKNAPMDSVEELLLLAGVTPDVYFGDPEEEQLPLSSLLTVHGDPRGRLNVNTAAPEALLAVGEALGAGGGFAEAIVDERERAPFESEDDLEGRGVIPRARDEEERREDPLRRYLVVESDRFLLKGDGFSNEAMVRHEANVWRAPGESEAAFRILSWRVIE
jgi:general secretion pathway protein K